MNFLKRFLGSGFVKHMQVGFLALVPCNACSPDLLSEALILLMSTAWIFFTFDKWFCLNRIMNSFKMSLGSHLRESIFKVLNIKYLVAKRSVHTFLLLGFFHITCMYAIHYVDLILPWNFMILILLHLRNFLDFLNVKCYCQALIWMFVQCSLWVLILGTFTKVFTSFRWKSKLIGHWYYFCWLLSTLVQL